MEKVQVSAICRQSRKGAACKPRREPSLEHNHACILISDPDLGLPTSRICGNTLPLLQSPRWWWFCYGSLSRLIQMPWEWFESPFCVPIAFFGKVKRWSHHRVAVKTKQGSINIQASQQSWTWGGCWVRDLLLVGLALVLHVSFGQAGPILSSSSSEHEDMLADC